MAHTLSSFSRDSGVGLANSSPMVACPIISKCELHPAVDNRALENITKRLERVGSSLFVSIEIRFTYFVLDI